MKRNDGKEKCVVERKGCASGKSACKEDGAGMGNEMAQVKLAYRPASARLNTVRCDGGMALFSHHTVCSPGIAASQSGGSRASRAMRRRTASPGRRRARRQRARRFPTSSGGGPARRTCHGSPPRLGLAPRPSGSQAGLEPAATDRPRAGVFDVSTCAGRERIWQGVITSFFLDTQRLEPIFETNYIR